MTVTEGNVGVAKAVVGEIEKVEGENEGVEE